MKKRVCILFSGQMRSNGLNPEYTHDDIILDSIKSFLLNETFKERYNYDVFISTDNIDIEKAKGFFGEDNLKNVFLHEKDLYFRKIKTYIKEFKYFKEEYSKKNLNGCDSHSHMLFMIYRLYAAYNLMINYQEETKTEYDYVIKIRPDSKLTKDTMELFDMLETSSKQIIVEHDHFAIVKYEFSEMFKLIETYGNYDEHIDLKTEIYLSFLTKGNELAPQHVMCFCPEKQFTDNIYYLLKSKDLNFYQSFHGFVYPTFTALYRGNGVYAYM